MKLGTWWASAAARILLMLGLAYASVWWSYQRFYAMFGVAPQDVGLVPNGGLSDIVGAVLRLGAWLTIALLALAVLPVIAVSAAGYIIERRPKRVMDIDVASRARASSVSSPRAQQSPDIGGSWGSGSLWRLQSSASPPPSPGRMRWAIPSSKLMHEARTSLGWSLRP